MYQAYLKAGNLAGTATPSTLAVSRGMVKSSAVHAAVALAPNDFHTGSGFNFESEDGGDILFN